MNNFITKRTVRLVIYVIVTLGASFLGLHVTLDTSGAGLNTPDII